jgi:hypothetical protein
VTVADAAGGTLPEVLRRLALTQNGEQICLWLKEQAGKINRQVDDLLKLHLAIPAPGSVLAYDQKPFEQPMPPRPICASCGGGCGCFLPYTGGARWRTATRSGGMTTSGPPGATRTLATRRAKAAGGSRGRGERPVFVDPLATSHGISPRSSSNSPWLTSAASSTCSCPSIWTRIGCASGR